MCRSKPLMFSSLSLFSFICFIVSIEAPNFWPLSPTRCAVPCRAACGSVIALPVSLSCFSPKWQKAASSFLWHGTVSPGFIVSRSYWELSFSVSVGCLTCAYWHWEGKQREVCFRSASGSICTRWQVQLCVFSSRTQRATDAGLIVKSLLYCASPEEGKR